MKGWNNMENKQFKAVNETAYQNVYLYEDTRSYFKNPASWAVTKYVNFITQNSFKISGNELYYPTSI